MATEDADNSIVFDFGRRERIGLAEAVLCQGKNSPQIAHLLALARERDAPLLLTRLDQTSYDALDAPDRDTVDYDPLSRTGFFGSTPTPDGKPSVALVSAGTSDLSIIREAGRTLQFYGQATAEFLDIGVAGLWRLLQREEELKTYPVVIVVAGMDGALFSVIGGLLPGVVIAVPSATGYGAARAGETALNSALASCAPGLLVVNIDNGYGAACAALRILNASEGKESSTS